MSGSKKHLKKLIAIRAGGRCEYCRVLEYLSNFNFHTEHIIGLQHGDPSTSENLAYACSWCNWKKGPNIATILLPGGSLSPLFSNDEKITSPF
ncbi:MAG: HNH endonuclease [Lewinellaceae bacterium]|nr:HNH endonuclease [Lewinellaceae bacterium]